MNASDSEDDPKLLNHYNFIICAEILTFFHCMFNRYFVIAAVPSWPGFPTWISRLVEFVLHVRKLLEKVIIYFLV